jgi:hypothetical protein
MSAKHKLNSANFLGALLIAGLIGGGAGSWTIFWIAFAGLLVADLMSGNIRR